MNTEYIHLTLRQASSKTSPTFPSQRTKLSINSINLNRSFRGKWGKSAETIWLLWDILRQYSFITGKKNQRRRVSSTSTWLEIPTAASPLYFRLDGVLFFFFTGWSKDPGTGGSKNVGRISGLPSCNSVSSSGPAQDMGLTAR